MRHPSVTLRFVPPAHWERIQLLMRLAIFCALAILGASLGWLTWVVYLLLPILAAAWAKPGFDQDTRRQLLRALRWWNGVIAYLLLVTDQFPNDADAAEPGLDVVPAEGHTIGSALARLLMSLPSFFVLALLAWIGTVIWLLGAFGVLLSGRVFGFAWRYMRFVVALHARWLVYHASLTDEYPSLGAPSEAEKQSVEVSP